jgi:hypothetical protein
VLNIKRLIIYSVFIALLLVTPKNTYALSEVGVQTMINTAISPINTAITSLQTAVLSLQNRVTAIEAAIAGIFNRLTTSETNITNHEARLTDLSNKIINLENPGPDFQPPVSWQSSFSSINRSLTLSTSKNTGNICKWNGVILTQQVQVRGVAHFPGSDVFAVGTCDVITFTNITDYPPIGTNVPIDLDLYWQEKLKHVQFNLTVP